MTSHNDPPLLKADNLTQRFADTIAVDALSLILQRGDILGLLGLNGAGKSSTLRMLSGTLAPTSGEIFIEGKSLTEYPLEVKRHIGYLPEVAPLYTDMRVDEYLEYAARLRNVPVAKIVPAIDQVIIELNLESFTKKRIGTLSKGYKQRVGLAQALVHDPTLVILDEPSSGLDPEQMREMRELIKSLGQHRGIVFSSHLLSEVNDVCTRVAVLHQGRLIHSGVLDDLQDQTDAQTTQHSIRFRYPTNTADLEAINGVESARRKNDNLWSIRIAAGNQDAVLTNLIIAGMSVVEFGPERPSLEALFSSLITESPDRQRISPPDSTSGSGQSSSTRSSADAQSGSSL